MTRRAGGGLRLDLPLKPPSPLILAPVQCERSWFGARYQVSSAAGRPAVPQHLSMLLETVLIMRAARTPARSARQDLCSNAADSNSAAGPDRSRLVLTAAVLFQALHSNSAPGSKNAWPAQMHGRANASFNFSRSRSARR